MLGLELEEGLVRTGHVVYGAEHVRLHAALKVHLGREQGKMVYMEWNMIIGIA